MDFEPQTVGRVASSEDEEGLVCRKVFTAAGDGLALGHGPSQAEDLCADTLAVAPLPSQPHCQARGRRIVA